MNIFITGINGFLGKELSRKLATDKNYKIFGSVSSKHTNHHYSTIDLNQPFNKEILKDMDWIIHCAYDLNFGNFQKNVDGTKMIMEHGFSTGIKKQIFISSYSAQELADSEYGLSKFELEKFCHKQGVIIVRPGLVMGHGGLFSRLNQIVNKMKVIPLIGKGNVTFPVITVNDLTCCMHAIIKEEVPGIEFNLFYKEQSSLRQLLEMLASSKHLKRYFIPIPVSLIYWGLWIAEKLKIKLPINLENLKGYTKNSPTLHQSHLQLFQVENKLKTVSF